jgi:hypothetical protein
MAKAKPRAGGHQTRGLTSAFTRGVGWGARLCVNGRPMSLFLRPAATHKKSPRAHGRLRGAKEQARPPVVWAHGIAVDCYGRDKRRNSQNCGGASSPRVVSHYARVQGARPLGRQSECARVAETRQHYFYSATPAKRAARKPPWSLASLLGEQRSRIGRPIAPRRTPRARRKRAPDRPGHERASNIRSRMAPR